MLEDLIIENPKRARGKRYRRSNGYPYYASFSDSFAHALIKSTGLPRDATIIDPWNGSGTTTAAATRLGYSTFGYDLNPVMVVAAKARLLNDREKPSLLPLTADIIKKTTKSIRCKSPFVEEHDPLCTWLTVETARGIRRIESAIQILLIDNSNYQSMKDNDTLSNLSDIAAFFYTALFRTVRTLLKKFMSSNPTWIKRPRDASRLRQSSLERITAIFESEVRAMIASKDEDINDAISPEKVSITLASSESLPVADSSVDLVLSSPPYCTRIDYAVATMPELALLGYEIAGDFQHLRKRLIGNSTVPNSSPAPSRVWGPSCIDFLAKLECHNSKASRSYYLKNHLQYFGAIFRSIGEIARTLRSGGACVLVVQDSYYKDLHNNLPLIVIEMAKANALNLERRADFDHRRTMAGIHPGVKQYRRTFGATESVLCFVK